MPPRGSGWSPAYRGNQVDVQVHDGLSGRLADVDADVESVGMVLTGEVIGRSSECLPDLANFLGRRAEQVGEVPLRDDQGMPGRDGKGVFHCQGQREIAWSGLEMMHVRIRRQAEL
jgi:hypothetical protein